MLTPEKIVRTRANTTVTICIVPCKQVAKVKNLPVQKFVGALVNRVSENQNLAPTRNTLVQKSKNYLAIYN